MLARQDWLYDQQRLAVTREVDSNKNEFGQRNVGVAVDMLKTNQVLDNERKEREAEAKRKEQEQDRQELQWTNAT